MNFQSSRRRGEDGVAMVINFLLSNARLVLGVGGAALLGIATLAVKRVSILRLSVPHHYVFAYDLCQNLEVSSPDIVPKPEAKSKRLQLCVLTLQERLQQYYSSRVVLAPHEVKRAQSLALDICTEIQGFLHSRHPDMPLGEMNLGGSLLDDLQVVSADHACLLVPLQLEPTLWRLIPGEETLLTHPLHWMVRRVNLEYFPRGRSYWDSKAVMETVNWPSISGHLDCLVRPILGGPDLRLEIRCVCALWIFCCLQCCLKLVLVSLSLSYIICELTHDTILTSHRLSGLADSREDWKYKLDFRYLESDVVLTAQPELTSPWVNAWHLSLYPWETQRLTQLDATDDGCRRLTLKVLKAVCKLSPPLRHLKTAPLANLILHLSDSENDWSKNSLDVRFQQCINELIGHLEQQALHSYFKPAVNLLSDLSEDQVDQMGFMLYCAVSDPEILLI
ncbi:hypothetical protein XENOCAPTIV_029219 [Xenoophorus captivus]|uniref:Mab-21-like HhH/H2TH-like domain-containing protein n=1 Tax=Xenoophorus captivus TaxID=1517983 RepID=A0ABV0QF32_9TELE